MNIDDPSTVEGQLKDALLLEHDDAPVVGAVGMCGVGKTCAVLAIALTERLFVNFLAAYIVCE
jgi:hypothetical protein